MSAQNTRILSQGLDKAKEMMYNKLQELALWLNEC